MDRLNPYYTAFPDALDGLLDRLNAAGPYQTYYRTASKRPEHPSLVVGELDRFKIAEWKESHNRRYLLSSRKVRAAMLSILQTLSHHIECGNLGLPTLRRIERLREKLKLHGAVIHAAPDRYQAIRALLNELSPPPRLPGAQENAMRVPCCNSFYDSSRLARWFRQAGEIACPRRQCDSFGLQTHVELKQTGLPGLEEDRLQSGAMEKAAREGNLKRIKRLVRQGAKIEGGFSKRSLLHRLPNTSSGVRCLQWLVRSGADTERCNEDGKTPLHVHLGLGNDALALALLKLGAECEGEARLAASNLCIQSLKKMLILGQSVPFEDIAGVVRIVPDRDAAGDVYRAIVLILTRGDKGGAYEWTADRRTYLKERVMVDLVYCNFLQALKLLLERGVEIPDPGEGEESWAAWANRKGHRKLALLLAGKGDA